MISYVKSVTWWIRISAGTMIGGLIYSQFQNFKTALYNQTKLRILIMNEKMEVLRLSFPTGSVQKLRRNKSLVNFKFFLKIILT